MAFGQVSLSVTIFLKLEPSVAAAAINDVLDQSDTNISLKQKLPTLLEMGYPRWGWRAMARGSLMASR